VSKVCMWNSRYNWNRQFCTFWSQWKHVCWELVHSHCLQFAFVVACVECIVIHSYILFKGKVQNRKVCVCGRGFAPLCCSYNCNRYLFLFRSSWLSVRSSACIHWELDPCSYDVSEQDTSGIRS
jgi:hypothetical protein